MVTAAVVSAAVVSGTRAMMVGSIAGVRVVTIAMVLAMCWVVVAGSCL